MKFKVNQFLGLFFLIVVVILGGLHLPFNNIFGPTPDIVEAKSSPSIPSIYGVIYPLNTRYPVSSSFGPRSGRNHNGTDLAAPTGTPVYSVQSGEVEVLYDPKGYGDYIVISHDGFDTLYAHLSKLHVRHKQTVRQGYRIGEVGETGNARGPHLHFEMRTKSWSAFDPEPVLAGASLPNIISPPDNFSIAEKVPSCLRSNKKDCDKPSPPEQLPNCADAAWGACLRKGLS